MLAQRRTQAAAIAEILEQHAGFGVVEFARRLGLPAAIGGHHLAGLNVLPNTFGGAILLGGGFHANAAAAALAGLLAENLLGGRIGGGIGHGATYILCGLGCRDIDLNLLAE